MGGGKITADRNKTRVNEDIRASHVLLIDTDGNTIGIVTKSVAIDKARDRGLDLVEVASQANPPVCRIMD
ncbi:MAG: translation initiation factor IF-3, partial [Elusimicrobia bacterium]|nr:translation initiation factor IF-3 [Elusimicrobiota bacterium]